MVHLNHLRLLTIAFLLGGAFSPLPGTLQDQRNKAIEKAINGLYSKDPNVRLSAMRKLVELETDKRSSTLHDQETRSADTAHTIIKTVKLIKQFKLYSLYKKNSEFVETLAETQKKSGPR